MFEQRKQLVLEKIEQIKKVIEARFGIKIPNLSVSFDLKGRAVGMARGVGNFYSVRFNRELMLNEGWDHLYNNTIPHELAHIVCYIRPELGKNHDKGWKAVCRALGGNGERVATGLAGVVTVTPARRERRYAYITSCGTAVTITQTRHNKILRGAAYSLRSGGRIDKSCQYRQVA